MPGAPVAGPTTVQTVSFLGELFQSGKRPNNFLRMVGGIQEGVMETSAREFPVGVTYTLRNPGQTVALEGAAAPASQQRSLAQSTNVVEIHQEAISLTYLGMSDQTMTGVVPLPQGKANGPIQNPRTLAFQVKTALDTISQDLNFAFINGQFQDPGQPAATALQTRGILTAIITNAIDQSYSGAGAAVQAGTVTALIYRNYIEGLLQSIITSNGFNPDETWTLFAAAQEYGNVCSAYEAAGTVYIQPESEYAGIKIRKILTRFGTINIVMDPDIPSWLLTTLSATVAAGVTTIILTNPTGFNIGDTLNIDSGAGQTNEQRVITSINYGTGAVTFATALTAGHAAACQISRPGTVGLFNMGVASVVGLPTPKKGILFYEPLAKVGSADQGQIYGQMGLDHGPEFCHGKVRIPAGTAL